MATYNTWPNSLSIPSWRTKPMTLNKILPAFVVQNDVNINEVFLFLLLYIGPVSAELLEPLRTQRYLLSHMSYRCHSIVFNCVIMSFIYLERFIYLFPCVSRCPILLWPNPKLFKWAYLFFLPLFHFLFQIYFVSINFITFYLLSFLKHLRSNSAIKSLVLILNPQLRLLWKVLTIARANLSFFLVKDSESQGFSWSSRSRFLIYELNYNRISHLKILVCFSLAV